MEDEGFVDCRWWEEWKFTEEGSKYYKSLEENPDTIEDWEPEIAFNQSLLNEMYPEKENGPTKDSC
jgi:hypothetical protein